MTTEQYISFLNSSEVPDLKKVTEKFNNILIRRGIIPFRNNGHTPFNLFNKLLSIFKIKVVSTRKYSKFQLPFVNRRRLNHWLNSLLDGKETFLEESNKVFYPVNRDGKLILKHKLTPNQICLSADLRSSWNQESLQSYRKNLKGLI